MGIVSRRDETRAGLTRPAAAIAVALALLACALPGSAGAAGFVRVDPAPLDTFKPFDLGVADANDDGHLDLFTTNHKFPSRYLAGDGSGGLTDQRVPLGLSSTPRFPGFDDVHRAPDTSAPGVYLYVTDQGRTRDPFHVETTGMPASGRLIFATRRMNVQRSTNATTSTRNLPDGSMELSFDAQPGADIQVTVDHMDLPIRVGIDSPAAPSKVKVGADAVPATTSRFELSLRDRHGFGFADFNSDGATDLFVATGGLGGAINDPYFVSRQSDELLLGGPTRFRQATRSSGLVKGTCRGRGTTVADFDGDGNLDVLEACDLARPRLFGGDGGGHFHELPAPEVAGDAYRAVDLDGDGRPELVAASGERIGVWDYADGAWTRTQSLRGRNGASSVRVLAQGDFDRDGDPDLFAGSPRGNAMLINRGGRLGMVQPRTLGIANNGSVGAAFVDVDNDGNLDLDLLPQGVFRADGGGRFTRTDRLKYGPLPNGSILNGTVSWPDLNEDGRRDPVSMRGRGEFAAEQVFDIRRSRVPSGHWLELDLVGPPGNRQAVGARVRVATAAGSQWGWVGEAETSGHSSGHYRLYFGLGKERRVRQIVVIWPDGRKRKLGGRRADRVLRVPYGAVAAG
jgi:hypothetical protein